MSRITNSGKAEDEGLRCCFFSLVSIVVRTLMAERRTELICSTASVPTPSFITQLASTPSVVYTVAMYG